MITLSQKIRARAFVLAAAIPCLMPTMSHAALNELPTANLLPVIPGEPETRSTPFIAWFMDLAEVGYVEEEYSIEGDADIYSYIDDGGPSPDVIADGAQIPYKTRILVRRPEYPKRFNGTVYYEVLNATAGWDGDPIWQSNYEYITREGAIWVGMSTKPVTVDFLRDGWAAWPLVSRNASRYADLAMPAFGQVWDMLAQTALLLKTPDEANNPLAGFDVNRIIMVGYSQSAAYQVTFVNSFHKDAQTPDGKPTIDGYFISAGGENAKHVTGPTVATPESLPAGDARNFLLTPVPTIRFQTQTEIVNFPSYTVRQSEQDSPWLRFYEMAGGSHVDAQINQVGGQALVRDLGLPPSFCPAPTGGDYNPIIIGNVQSALMDRLDRWIDDGLMPPASRFMELVGPANSPSLKLDADGNAVGGVRPPQLEVPLGQYKGTNTGPGFCFLFGAYVSFDEAVLEQRYRNRGSYVSQLVRAVKRSQKEGFLLNEDATKLRRAAAESPAGE
jgi:hypothetical protein